MTIDHFNENFWYALMDKISSENKISYLSGDFNIDLLKIETDDNIQNYYNALTANLFVPHITLPTRITSHSQTLIDNIFSNDPNFAQGISGNFTFSISDHLAQFLIVPRIQNRPPKKHNICKRKMKQLNKADLVADVININWQETLSCEFGDPQYSFEKFDKKMTETLDRHVPLTKLNKKELKLLTKPWITPGIIKSIKRRDNLLQKFIKTSDIDRKNRIHEQYKSLRNQIVGIIRRSKKNHFQKYFSKNAKNIRKTWTGIKSIINIRSTIKAQPASIMIGDQLETDPVSIADGFNNYFSQIAEKLQQDVFNGRNHFWNYLKDPLDHNFIF